jgi:hypothetical protein
MQCILGVDLSSQPCEITVSNISGTVVEVVERQTIDLPLFGDERALLDEECTELLGRSDDEPSQGENEPPLESDDGPAPQELDHDREATIAALKQTVSSLRAALAQLRHNWTSIAVILPPYEHLALNLNLPFGDAKNLNKIVDLEVQDVVPFELDEFLVQHSALGPIGKGSSDAKSQAGAHDVHVAILPTAYVRNILAVCNKAGLDPAVLTVPSSAAGAVFHIAKDFFRDNAALVHSNGKEYSITLLVDGKVRAEQVVIPSNLLASAANGEAFDTKPAFSALKLMLAATERRYNVRIEKIYLLGRVPDNQHLHQIMGRPVEPLPLTEIVQTQDTAIGLSPLAAFFAQDESPATALSNFRTKQFSFRPRFAELLRALKESSGHVLGAVAMIAVSIAGVYGVREYNLSRSKERVIAELQTVVPDFPAETEDIRAALVAAESKLSQDLGVLGSPAKITPLDALVEIIRLVPESTGIQILSIKVSGTRAQVSGIAPQLSAIEDLERTLRASKGLFSKTTATPGTASGSRFPFNLELILAQ